MIDGKTIANSAVIHSSSIVDLPAAIGENTRIWQFCHVMAGAQIGSNCVLGQNTFVAGTVVIGNGCHIQNNVSLYDGVVLEEDVFVGPSCVFTNVRHPRAAISRRGEFLPTIVRQGATLGANSTIVAGVIIGSCAFVGAGSVVTQNIAEYSLVVGNPARPTGWVSQAGEPLIFVNDRAICPRTRQVYLRTASGIVACAEPRDGSQIAATPETR